MKNTVQKRAVEKMISLERDAAMSEKYANECEHDTDKRINYANSAMAWSCKSELIDIYNIITGKDVQMDDYDEVIADYHRWAAYQLLK